MSNRTIAMISFCIISTLLLSGKTKYKFDVAHANNWEYVVRNSSQEPTELFKMNQGVLSIKDSTVGYLRTKDCFKNYTVDLEWRWTKVLANSGILIHIQKPDTIWPICYQVQQKADAAGDIICMNGLWAKECTDTIKTTVPKMKKSNEKPLGEWNTMKIISKNGTLTVYVNAELQNKITGLTAKKGYIGFQAESKPIEFRNLSIK